MTRRAPPPLAIDLCCGLGGWTAGLLAEGWDVIGVDIVAPRTWPAGAGLMLADVRDLSGVPWRGRASLVVASPPCTEFSQMWNIARHRRPNVAAGMTVARACFRFAREVGAWWVLENVRGACQPFAPEFGRPTWKIGSYYFWGHPLILRPYGSFQKGIWNTERGRWGRDNRSATYVRDPARRALIPIEISRAVAREFWPGHVPHSGAATTPERYRAARARGRDAS